MTVQKYDEEKRQSAADYCRELEANLLAERRKVQSIETSKELLRCAEWLHKHGMYDPAVFNDHPDLLQWSELLKSIVIPAPNEKDI